MIDNLIINGILPKGILNLNESGIDVNENKNSIVYKVF